MDTKHFETDFSQLSCELLEFQYSDDESDEEIARRLIENSDRNPKSILIAAAKALVDESSALLRDFDQRWEEFVEVSNLTAFEKKEEARAWLKKMNGLWKKTLDELESP